MSFTPRGNFPTSFHPQRHLRLKPELTHKRFVDGGLFREGMPLDLVIVKIGGMNGEQSGE
jgi:hypothetical protein